jgi:hypothetical protein
VRLSKELQRQGFDCALAHQTYGDLDRHAEGNADWYVEIVSGQAGGHPLGGIGVGGSNVGAEISLVVARVAAELRVYDGRTLELFDSFDLHRSAMAVVPTALGVGGRHLYAYIALPFIQYARYRAAAGAVARDAASMIASSVRGEVPTE